MNGKGVKEASKKSKSARKRARRNARMKSAAGAPIAVGVSVKSKSVTNTTTYKGRDFLTSVQLGQTISGANQLMADVPIAPGRFEGTRISLLARAFEKYRFKKCKVIYEPSVPTTVGGQFVMYFELDPLDRVETTDELTAIRNAMAHQGALLGNVNMKHSIELPIKPGLPNFFTGSPEGPVQLYYQAVFRMVASAGLNGTGAPTSGVVGALFVEYEVHFEGEQMLGGVASGSDSPVSGAIQTTMQAAAGNVTSGVNIGTATPVIFNGVTVTGFETTTGDGIFASSTAGTDAAFVNAANGGTAYTAQRSYFLVFSKGIGLGVGITGTGTAVAAYEGYRVNTITAAGTVTTVLTTAEASDVLRASLVRPSSLVTAEFNRERELREMRAMLRLLQLENGDLIRRVGHVEENLELDYDEVD